MSEVNLIHESDGEIEIASQAASVLRECFIAAAKSGPVMYVENDTVVRKAPNSPPIVIKYLSERNPELAQLVASRRIFKIRKRIVNLN